MRNFIFIVLFGVIGISQVEARGNCENYCRGTTLIRKDLVKNCHPRWPLCKNICSATGIEKNSSWCRKKIEKQIESLELLLDREDSYLSDLDFQSPGKNFYSGSNSTNCAPGCMCNSRGNIIKCR